MDDAFYGDLPRIFAKADARSTRYQFDLERDPCWNRSRDPGSFVPRQYLADLGLRLPLEGSQAEELLQWAYALAIADGFTVFEESLIQFIEFERAVIVPTRSLRLLCEEERKHIELFRRISSVLRAIRPDQVEAFERVFAPTRNFVRAIGSDGQLERGSLSGQEAHYIFWMKIMFVEEFTLYFYDRLQRGPGEIQPLWLSAHAAHRQEEMQHIVTDVNYIRAVNLDAASRLACSKAFVIGLVHNLGHYVCTIPSARLVELKFPELQPLLPAGGVTKTNFFKDLLHSPAFRRTRQCAPYFEELLSFAAMTK